MVHEVDSPFLKVCPDAPLMPDRSPAGIHQAAREVGPLQTLSHFGGEFERRPDGTIRGFDVFDGVNRGDTNQYYRDFVRAMRDIGYQGYMSYELCHPLPAVDGRTVDISYAHQNAQLAAAFMRDLIESEPVPASRKSPEPVARS
jgi:sugar phosphate isomerase/epimerase